MWKYATLLGSYHHYKYYKITFPKIEYDPTLVFVSIR